MGFNAQRGDSLNVVNAPFSQPEAAAPPEAPPFWKHPDVIALAKETGKALLFLVLAMIVVFGVVRPALRAFTAAQERATVEAPPQPAQLAMSGPSGETNVSPLEQVRQLAKNDPATVANVVKSWVGNEGKA
jgi:flagellar M-ring protein FliF